MILQQRGHQAQCWQRTYRLSLGSFWQLTERSFWVGSLCLSLTCIALQELVSRAKLVRQHRYTLRPWRLAVHTAVP